MSIFDFFKFDEKLSSATLQAHPIGLNFEENSNRLNDVLKLLMGDYSGINFPVEFKQAYGKRLDDVIRTGHGALYLISNKMKNVLEENKLTGWKTFSIKILEKQGSEIKGYQGLSIIGRCGPIDYSKCTIIEKRTVPEGPLIKSYKGLYVGLDKWDGSDFFLPEGTFQTIITKRAANVMKKNKLTNVRLQNLSEIETPEYALKKAQ